MKPCIKCDTENKLTYHIMLLCMLVLCLFLANSTHKTLLHKIYIYKCSAIRETETKRLKRY